jgi:peptidoglycan hydrolase-like protein with peptidoglycan-binding domain
MEMFAYLHHASEYEASSADLVQETWNVNRLEYASCQNRIKCKLQLHLISLVLIPFIAFGLNGAAWALQREDEGQEVMVLQRKLWNQGYLDVEPTGFYGALTEDAVLRFQAENGLRIDGIAGDETQAALNMNISALTSTSFSESASFRQYRSNSVQTPVSPRSDIVSRDVYSDKDIGSTSSRILATVPPFNPIEQNLVVNFQPTVSATVFLRPKDFDFKYQTDFSPKTNPQSCQEVLQNDIRANNTIEDFSYSSVCLEKALVKLGYLAVDYRQVSGEYAQNTVDAVAAFQRDKGIEIDGVAGSETIAAIVREVYFSKERIIDSGYFWWTFF